MIATPEVPTYNPIIGGQLKDFIRYSEVKQLLYKVIDLQQERGTEIHSLAVLSAFQGEGKTLFCAALAMAYVEACRSRMLVVDTTTYHHPDSLNLRKCLNPDNPQIDFLSLSENRTESVGPPPHSTRNPDNQRLLLASGNGSHDQFEVSMVMESEYALIQRFSKERAKHYGLVLLDTAPLNAKNKNNLDPSLVARLSDAAVLIAGKKLLNTPQINDQLSILKDPALHLIGVVSNERYTR